MKLFPAILTVSSALLLNTRAYPFISNQPAQRGASVFSAQCAGCHGPDTRGTDRAPSLANNRRLRSRSLDQVRGIIEHGIPGTGMPAFHFANDDLGAVARFVHGLNSAAADAVVQGDVENGQRFFWTTGQCGACHMVRGRGSPLGPDLSNVARELTLDEIRGVLAYPDGQITPGYELADVTIRNRPSLRGFVRSRSAWGVVVQDFGCRFHFVPSKAIVGITFESHSLMKPVPASPSEQQNLIAYLATLGGIEPGSIAAPDPRSVPSGLALPFTRILHPSSGEWLTYNGTIDANRRSSLAEITTANAAGLRLKWIFPIPHFALETTPLVVDGVMYVTGPNQVYALAAASGQVIWKYARPTTPGLVGDASLGTNRGVALHEDKLFVVTDNAHLLALNRATGSLVWEVVMPDEPQHYGSTVAPLVVDNTVIAGVSGGDWGIRGFIACYRADTGERIWRRWTIPAKGEAGYETWQRDDPRFGGGSTWLTGSYDPELKTLFWPTGNPWPDSDDSGRPGDNLYTDCLLALDPRDGAIKWYRQFTPHDVADRDANEPPVLVDLEYQKRMRKLLLHADRNGFFYVLDRTDGQLLLAKPFLRTIRWTSGIGADGRPLPVQAARGLSRREAECPNDAANWSSTSFSPATRLYYVMTLEQCLAGPPSAQLHQNDARAETGAKFLRAISIDTGAVVWEKEQIGLVSQKMWPGILTTASGILFVGDPAGAFAALDERTGETLWHFATNVAMKASPMTYSAGGRQYVAVAAGSNILSFGLPE